MVIKQDSQELNQNQPQLFSEIEISQNDDDQVANSDKHEVGIISTSQKTNQNEDSLTYLQSTRR
jgi:hypothetical protein